MKLQESLQIDASSVNSSYAASFRCKEGKLSFVFPRQHCLLSSPRDCVDSTNFPLERGWSVVRATARDWKRVFASGLLSQSKFVDLRWICALESVFG